MFRRFTIVALFLFFAHAGLQADESPTSSLLIPVAKEQQPDAATWGRLVEGYQEEKQQFLRLLLELDSHRTDLAQDSLQSVLEKKRAIAGLLETHKQQCLAEMSPPEIILDYVRIRNATSPRPSGRIIEIGPGQKWETLPQAASEIRSGDVVQLGVGGYDFPGTFAGVTDLAFVGKGAASTRLNFSRAANITDAVRWRIADCEIDCNDNPFASLRDGKSLALENCRIFNYNSGAGGSDAIFGTDVIIRVEDCVFDGLAGRANRAGSGGGNAFDLRGDNLLYARRCQFINNSAIVRVSFPCVFDRCTAMNESRWSVGVAVFDGASIFVRDSQIPMVKQPPIPGNKTVHEFAYSVEDPSFVRHVLGEKAPDERTRQLAEKLNLERSVPYWIGLLQHPSWVIRRHAAERIAFLSGERVNVPAIAEVAEGDIDNAIRDLDSADFDTRAAAAKRLDEVGFQAESALRKLLERGGSRSQESAAKALLARLDLTPWVQESGDLMNWYETHKDRLIWDETTGKYRRKP